jgi:HlyD family secretion protein
VISRQVDAGQTVAASLNTPTLFTIAEDLSKMQVAVAIDETDIGRVRPDQRATFTVDAFPGRTFNGTVQQIRKSATTVQNVVTYTVIVDTPNPDLRLGARHDRERAHRLRQPRQRAEGRRTPRCAGARPARARRTTARPPRARRAAGGGGGGDMQARRQRLVDDLKLDARAGGARRRDLRRAAQPLRRAAGHERADRRQRGERMRAEVRQKINAILNAEQQKRYAEIVASETGRAGGGGAGACTRWSTAKPTEVAIRTASPTANATEVVSGRSRKATR